jgi:hypothetical protein
MPRRRPALNTVFGVVFSLIAICSTLSLLRTSSMRSRSLFMATDVVLLSCHGGDQNPGHRYPDRRKRARQHRGLRNRAYTPAKAWMKRWVSGSRHRAFIRFGRDTAHHPVKRRKLEAAKESHGLFSGDGKGDQFNAVTFRGRPPGGL